MSVLGGLAALGVWVAIPLTGYVALGDLARRYPVSALPVITRVALVALVGLILWTAPILLSAAAGVYSGELVGVLGWLAAAAILAFLYRTRPFTARASTPLTRWEYALGVGLFAAAGLYLAFPAESILGGPDQHSYALHGIYIANHGRLDIPYPYPPDAQDLFFGVFERLSGTFKTLPTMQVGFGHVLPAWLAQAYETWGPHGMYRLNAVFAVLALCAFYGVCRTWMRAPFAVAATLFLAFNPSQMWMARITLTEILTQLTIWSGLLLLALALKSGDVPSARWAGLFLGFSALVRIDSLLMLPLMLLAHLATRILEEPRGEPSRAWYAFYQTAVPAFGLAISYFAVVSSRYLEMHRPQVLPIGALTLASLVALLVARRRVIEAARPLVTSRAPLSALGVALVAVWGYLYFVRPRHGPFPRFHNAESYLYGQRSFAELSLVNLAQYLSPPVVWLALGSWFAAIWFAVRGRRDLSMLVILVAVGGVSALYLWSPVIFPRHFWAIRRFVPVTIPGFVLLAALGACRLLSRVSGARLTALGAACALFLVVFTVRADRFVYAFAEYRGSYDQFKALAAALPEDEPILAAGRRVWWKPLYVAFDREVIPMRLGTGPGAAALERWTARRHRLGKPVYILSEGDLRLPGLRATPVFSRVISFSQSERVVRPLPRKAYTVRRTIKLYRISSDPARPSAPALDIRRGETRPPGRPALAAERRIAVTDRAVIGAPSNAYAPGARSGASDDYSAGRKHRGVPFGYPRASAGR